MALEEENSNQITLSEEQVKALEAVKEKKNVFITGSAGVGKSFLLNQILKELKHKIVYVTASTGVAACNIGGTTLHSFGGIGLGTKSAQSLAYEITYKRYKVDVKERWLSCQVLIIDEISMIDGELFNKVEHIARLVRNSDQSFGGIQLILIGDFLQLPPVKVKKFAFETDAWKKSIEKTITLKKVFRQKLVGFVLLLNRLRVGRLTALDVEVLHECSKTKFPDDGIKPTRLFPHRSSCDKINLDELKKLREKVVVYTAIDYAKDNIFREQLEKNSKFPKVLEIKIGAQVMLLTNLSVGKGLVNGARGVVIGLRNRKKELEERLNELIKENVYEEDEDLEACQQLLESMDGHESYKEDGYPIIKFANGIECCITPEQSTIEVGSEKVAYRTQVPLALAWAVSIHKSQGMTLERIDIKIANVFEHGQAYVALSRVTSLDGLLLRDFNPCKITAHPKVLQYYQKINPTLCENSTQGEEDLKTFIDRRKNPTKYAHEIEEMERKKTEMHLRQEIERLERIRLSMEAAYKQYDTIDADTMKKNDSYTVIEDPIIPVTSDVKNSNLNVSVIDLTKDSTSPSKQEPTIPGKGYVNIMSDMISPMNVKTPPLCSKSKSKLSPMKNSASLNTNLTAAPLSTNHVAHSETSSVNQDSTHSNNDIVPFKSQIGFSSAKSECIDGETMKFETKIDICEGTLSNVSQKCNENLPLPFEHCNSSDNLKTSVDAFNMKTTSEQLPTSQEFLTTPNVEYKMKTYSVLALADEKLRKYKIALEELNSVKAKSDKIIKEGYTVRKKESDVEGTTGVENTNLKMSSHCNFSDKSIGGLKKVEPHGFNSGSNALVTDGDGNVTVVIESDPEELFDDNINANISDSSDATENTKILTVENLYKKEDIVDEKEVGLFTPEHRKGKRKSCEDCMTSDNECKIQKSENITGKHNYNNISNNPTVSSDKSKASESHGQISSPNYNDDEIKTLLALKQDEINEKRQQALMRRLSSLKRDQTPVKR